MREDLYDTNAVQSSQPVEEAPPGIPWEAVFGRTPLPFPELVKKIEAASWPSEVILHPIDFFAITAGMPALPREEETGRPYFWINATKVACKLPRPGLLNLSEWEPPKVALFQVRK